MDLCWQFYQIQVACQGVSLIQSQGIYPVGFSTTPVASVRRPIQITTPRPWFCWVLLIMIACKNGDK